MTEKKRKTLGELLDPWPEIEDEGYLIVERNVLAFMFWVMLFLILGVGIGRFL